MIAEEVGSLNGCNEHLVACTCSAPGVHVGFLTPDLLSQWGVQPLCVREGGTMPVASALEKLLQAPALLIPMGQSSDSPHLANERIQRINLFRGRSVVMKLLQQVAQAI